MDNITELKKKYTIVSMSISDAQLKLEDYVEDKNTNNQLLIGSPAYVTVSNDAIGKEFVNENLTDDVQKKALLKLWKGVNK